LFAALSHTENKIMQTNIVAFTDWHRTRKALSQEFRGDPLASRIERVIDILPRVLAICGGGSQNRRMILKIARALVPERPVIYAPCCPDYGNDGETYTFRGLGCGVSLLAERHIAFLQPISDIVPEAHIVLLLADQEVEDAEILRAVGVDANEFKARMDASLEATKRRVAAYGWEAGFMTEKLPDLCQTEIAFAKTIEADDSKRVRLTSETISRTPMYARINRTMSLEEMFRRTVRTAAQYLAMGHLVARKNALVCNHTTTNLSWYGETNAAVLHDPISVY